jgi:hypothetical protein
MNLTTEQLQMAALVDAKVQRLVREGQDEVSFLREMFDCMPIFKILLDSGHDTMDKLCQRFAGSYHYSAKRLPRANLRTPTGCSRMKCILARRSTASLRLSPYNLNRPRELDSIFFPFPAGLSGKRSVQGRTVRVHNSITDGK